VLGVREEPGRPLAESLVVRIGKQKLLLVLDTCQHLIDATAGLADALLSACPNLVMVATTRQFLGIPSETVVHVAPLSVPDAGSSPDVEEALQSDAVRLYVKRAAAYNRGFALTDQTVGAVVEVCRRLDGLPLAIELAARMVALPVEQLATRLDERFRLLVGGSRTAHWRHRTLQASVDCSYELLEPDERQLFERLSVFVDGFGLDAAEVICGADGLQPVAVLGLVRLLVEKSLVNADVGSIDARYHLLETLRQYAWERLMRGGQAEATQTRHAAYYLAFATQGAKLLQGPERTAWLDRLERDQGNVRAALHWFGDRGDAQACLQLMLALLPFRDARAWLEAILPLAELRAQLGDEDFDRAWATGAAMSVEQVASRAETPAILPTELASGSVDLTRRELEVLQLIASGLGNREIAEQLVLSVRTVERHITNLYGKIRVRGKAGATAYALRHGIAEG
jgi:predicted ATPase/DNA-binding CsgD family transcriptional regulator